MTSDCSSDYTNCSAIKKKDNTVKNSPKLNMYNFGLVDENILGGKVHKLLAKIEHRIL